MPEIIHTKHNEILSETVQANDLILICRVADVRSPAVITDTQLNTYAVQAARQDGNYLEISSAVCQSSGLNTLSIVADGDITVILVRGIEDGEDGPHTTSQTKHNLCVWQCVDDGEWLAIGIGQCPNDWVPVVDAGMWAVKRLDSLGMWEG